MLLKSTQEVDAFLSSEREYEEKTGFFRNNSPSLGKNYDDLRFKTRVIAFIFDKEESEEEIGQIREVAKLMSQKMGTRVGLVTEPKIIRKYKESFGTYWFPDSVQLNTIIV